MPNFVVACAFVCFALTAAFVVGRFCVPEHRDLMLKVYGGWVGLTVLMFVTPHPFLFVLLASGVLLAFSPKETSGRLMFFCAMLPAAPSYIGWDIPFPGINHLFRLNYPVFLNLVLLLPLLFRPRADADRLMPRESRRIIYVAMTYVVLISILDFRDTSFTNGMRNAFDHMVSYGILILALYRGFGNQDAARNMVIGIFLGGLMLLFVGLMQDFRGWLMYSSVNPSLITGTLDYQDWMEMRGGALRIPGTMNAIPFGVYMAICILACVYLVTSRQVSKSALWLILLFTYGMIGSDSRGAMLVTALGLVLMMVHSPRFLWMRRPFQISAVMLILAVFTTGLGDALLEADEHGTFTYRVDLVKNSSNSVSNHPLFGTPEYMEDPMLELSRQGQGIIDIVNAYLSILLAYGFVGLLLFFGALWMSLSNLGRFRTRCQELGNVADEQLARFAMAATASFGFAIITVSLVDRLPQVYWMLICLSAAVLSKAEVESVRERVPA